MNVILKAHVSWYGNLLSLHGCTPWGIKYISLHCTLSQTLPGCIGDGVGTNGAGEE